MCDICQDNNYFMCSTCLRKHENKQVVDIIECRCQCHTRKTKEHLLEDLIFGTINKIKNGEIDIVPKRRKKDIQDQQPISPEDLPNLKSKRKKHKGVNGTFNIHWPAVNYIKTSKGHSDKNIYKKNENED